MEQKGSKLLKIVSIIMMIGGIVSAVFSVIAAALAGVERGIQRYRCCSCRCRHRCYVAA